MAPRNSAVLSTTPLATSSGNEASPRTNKRPRRDTKLPERYRPDDPSYSSLAPTLSTSSPAPPPGKPVVAQGRGWFTVLEALKPGEKSETLREARIRQGLPMDGDPPIIRRGRGWHTQLELASEEDSPEQIKKAVTPSRQRIRKDMVDKRPRQQIPQESAKTYRGADAGDDMEVEMERTDGSGVVGVETGQEDGAQVLNKEAEQHDSADMEVEMEQTDGSGVVGVKTGQQDGADVLNKEAEQHDSADILNKEAEQHDSADPMELETTKNDGVVDTPPSSPLSDPMSEDALADLLRTPTEESETSEEELPPHPAFTGQDFTLGGFKYLEKHLRDNDALGVLKEVEPDFTRHQPRTVFSPTLLPPTSPNISLPPATFSIAALPSAGSAPTTSRPASLRPASLQPISSPPGGSPIDSPQAPPSSIITPPAASPHATTTSPSPLSQPASAPTALQRTASPPTALPHTTSSPPSPAPMASAPSPPAMDSSPPTASSSSSSASDLLLLPPASSSSSSSPPDPSHCTLAPHKQAHGRGPFWSDWIGLWAGSCYVPDHVRDVLDTIPEDGPYFDVPAGQIQTVNASCADFGDPEGARAANFVLPGVEGRYMRTRPRK